MRVLIAEDDPIARHALRYLFQQWGLDVVEARTGAEARAILRGPDRPSIAILDWVMPEVDGPALCREIRADAALASIYVVMVTGKSGRHQMLAGLEAGADDYLVKPVDWQQLRARVAIGCRIVALQEGLTSRVAELQDALARVKKLSGLLPICSYCKKIRDDHDYWQQLESYLSEHSEATFSHGICPSCFEHVCSDFHVPSPR